MLSGLHRVDRECPTLSPGGRVGGRLLRTEEVDRLVRPRARYVGPMEAEFVPGEEC